MERKRQLAMKKGNAIFGPLRFNLIISKFQAMWRGKMERRKVKKKTLPMQMKEAGDRDWTREIGVLEPEPESEPEPETTPQPAEAGADEADGDNDVNPAVAAAQKALDAAKAEQKKAKDALEKPKQKLKKKAKNAARAALAEADKRVAEAERKLRIEEPRSEEHTSELQSPLYISYAVF
jgi:FtsZ-interacting cell division protein ZipA